MAIFMSWSGNRSRQIADELSQVIKSMLPGIDIFFSPKDLDPGKPWLDGIRTALNESNFGLLIITNENIDSHWMLFESGAIAGGASDGPICALLFDEISPEKLPSPITHFQHCRPVFEDFSKLITNICTHAFYLPKQSIDSSSLQRSLKLWWNEIQKIFKKHQRISNTPYKTHLPNSLSKLWEKEKNSKTVWIFSPELYHDLYNPECVEAVKFNRERGVSHRYILPNWKDVPIRVSNYQEKYKMEKHDVDNEFLLTPPPCDEVGGFLIEIVIYNPISSNSSAYGYHPHSGGRTDDIVEFGPDDTKHFIDQFLKTWERSGRIP